MLASQRRQLRSQRRRPFHDQAVSVSAEGYVVDNQMLFSITVKFSKQCLPG
jgi:hypothetical protein